MADAVERVGLAVSELWSLRRARGRALGSAGCSATGLTLLYLLSRSGRIRVSALAARLEVDTSVASRQLSQLETAGMVAKSTDAADRRAHLVEITEEGRRALAAARQGLLERWKLALADWSHADLEDLARRLDQLRADLVTAGLFHGAADTPEFVHTERATTTP